MASGSGDSLGKALLSAIAEEAGGQIGMRRSYTAKGWHAQISKLTSSPRGYEAAEKAGLSVNRRTLTDWLAERREPTPENQRRIAAAYRFMAGAWPKRVEQAEIKIRGEVQTGSDRRERGAPGNAPLLVDGSQGQWARLQAMWEGGDPDPDDFEDAFVEDVIVEDLGEGSDGWEFPGSSYAVTM